MSQDISSPARRPLLDHPTERRVNRWLCRWHGADYDPDEFLNLIKEWPAPSSLARMIEPVLNAEENESPRAMALLVLSLIKLIERNTVDMAQAQGAFRMACMYLCQRGIPFEETAKGNEAALRLHFLASSEFGDAQNMGFPTDFTELRLLARYLIEPEDLLEELLDDDYCCAFTEAHVSVAAYLADARLVPVLKKALSRCEDIHCLATIIDTLGRIGSPELAKELEGYAYSMQLEVSTSAVLALEAIGGSEAQRILEELESIISDEPTFLRSHVELALLRVREGEAAQRDRMLELALDGKALTVDRLCALERLSGTDDEEVLRAIAGLLEDASSVEHLPEDGFLISDDILYSVRDAAYLALMDCRIDHLVSVLGEDILDRLELFHSPPS